MAKVKYEGSEITVADEIASDDAKLRAALVTAWPSISTADITRTKEDNILVVSCAKRAGSKGGPREVAKRLTRAAEFTHPAFELAAKIRIQESLGKLTPGLLLSLAPKIRSAIKTAEAQRQAVDDTAHKLSHLPAVASRQVPPGF